MLKADRQFKRRGDPAIPVSASLPPVTRKAIRSEPFTVSLAPDSAEHAHASTTANIASANHSERCCGLVPEPSVIGGGAFAGVGGNLAWNIDFETLWQRGRSDWHTESTQIEPALPHKLTFSHSARNGSIHDHWCRHMITRMPVSQRPQPHLGQAGVRRTFRDTLRSI